MSASRQSAAVAGSVEQLFGRGTLSGLDEGRLLERFVADRDESAFAGLVERFGPMVLGVCRRHLSDHRDVEDAFQATFLVLVRKAGSIREPKLIGNWLYGAAVRVASRARAEATQRRAREEPLVDAARDVRRDDLRSSLDEEIARLPEKYRRPLVLCYLEGLTHDEAAERLRCPVGTVRSRMAWARDRLRTRLTRLAAAVPSGEFVTTATSPHVPHGLFETTVRFASLSCAELARDVSARVEALTRGVIRAMMFKTVGLVLVVSAAIFGGIGLKAMSQSSASPSKDSSESALARAAGVPKTAGSNKLRLITGRTERILVSLTRDKQWVWAYTFDNDGWGWDMTGVNEGTITPILGGNDPTTEASGDISLGQPTNLVALDMRGEKIEWLAAFSSKTGKWRLQGLEVPTSGRVSPVLNSRVAVYCVEGYAYGYSALTGSWDVLKLGKGEITPPFVVPQGAIIEQGDRVHVFNAKRGDWSSNDPKRPGDGVQ